MDLHVDLTVSNFYGCTVNC